MTTSATTALSLTARCLGTPQHQAASECDLTGMQSKPQGRERSKSSPDHTLMRKPTQQTLDTCIFQPSKAESASVRMPRFSWPKGRRIRNRPDHLERGCIGV